MNVSFSGKTIPYGTHIDIPDVPAEDYPKVENDEEKNEIVRKMINKLTIEFHPDMIPNPKYRKKHLYVKSKLLDEDIDDEHIKVFDKKSLDEHVRDEIEQVKTAFGLGAVVSNSKRKKPAKASTGPKKRKN